MCFELTEAISKSPFLTSFPLLNCFLGYVRKFLVSLWICALAWAFAIHWKKPSDLAHRLSGVDWSQWADVQANLISHIPKENFFYSTAHVLLIQHCFLSNFIAFCFVQTDSKLIQVNGLNSQKDQYENHFLKLLHIIKS